MTRGREPSVSELSKADRRAEGWKSGVHSASFTRISVQFTNAAQHSGCGSIELGTPFAKGAVKMATTHHTHSSQLMQNLTCFRIFPEQGRNPSLPVRGTEVSINGKGSLRPFYCPLSEASSR